MDRKKVIELIEAGKIKLSSTCPLCNQPADGIGFFVPKTEEFAKEIGQPEGKQRIASYPSCSACQMKLGLQEYMCRIELVMRADMKGKNVTK
jgi:hypothetical protein